MTSVSQNPSTDCKILRVLLVARVSDPGPGKQDERSVEDQEALLRSWVAANIPNPCEFEVFASSGPGEWIDRAEFQELRDKVMSGVYDLLVTEDLGRILRRLQAHMFVEECVDHDTRVIALNDHVDTAEPGWEDRSIFSAWHHERSNRDTSMRIKRTHRSRFQSGGCAAIPIYGYIKPPGAKSDMDWIKDPEAEPIYEEWFQRLNRGDSFQDIADWLNENGVPTGPYCESEKWDGTTVGRVSRNPILKGMRQRNVRESYRDSRGKYRTRKADPAMLLQREVSHLAFFEPEYYDRIIADVNARNAIYRRGQNGDDPRKGVFRKRTRYPGQTVYCGVCGKLYVFGGHGQTDRLMCNGAREHKCWNGVTFDAPLAARRIADAVLEVIESLPDFDEQFLAEINAEADRLDDEYTQQIGELDFRSADIERRLDNLVEFIGDGKGNERVRRTIEQLESELSGIVATRRRLATAPRQRIEIPDIEELKTLAHDSLLRLAEDDWEFCKLLRRLVPRIIVHPYRLFDGGTTVLRASFRIHPAGLLEDPRVREALQQPLECIRTVDLFDPPQRVACREKVVELMRSGKYAYEAARECGITATTAQRASAIQREMDERGLSDPYIRLTDPPEDSSKLRRHKHPRYCFDPLPDAGKI